MRLVFVISFILLLAACSTRNTICYSFNGVTIARVDYGGATNFYYGCCDIQKAFHSDTAYVRAEYFGFNNGMDAYLIFKKDSSVEIVNYGVDRLEKRGDSKIEIGDYNNDAIIKKIDVFKHQGAGIIRISNVVSLEKRFPQNANSLVIAKYGSSVTHD